jgi:hypothetical protein
MHPRAHRAAHAAGLLATIAIVACSGSAPVQGRCVLLGTDMALELAFDDSVVLTIEAQAADMRSFQPCGYLVLKTGIEKVSVTGPIGTTDLRVTLGVGGRLVDREDGKSLADGTKTVIESSYARPVDVRDARIGTQLQIARGTIATVRLDGTTTQTTTRPFQP